MLASIFNTFANCFKIPELKSRILFTMLVLAICRLAAYIVIPGLDGATLKAYFESVSATGSSALGLFSTFTGGAVENCAVGGPGHHALYQRDDCDAIADGGGAVLEQDGAGRGRAGEDHQVQPLPDGFDLHRPGDTVGPGLGAPQIHSGVWRFSAQHAGDLS